MKHIAIVLVTVALSGCIFESKNSKPEYSDFGAPKNCRALIKENIDGWRTGRYKADEALFSIDRNCGEYGIIWNE